nr:hypothetical protein [Tanacetum cinerariifolium]
MTELPLVDSYFADHVFSLGDDPIACLNKAMFFNSCTFLKPKLPRNATWYKDKAMLAEAQEAGQTEDLNTYDSDYDDISNAKAVLMANISNYGSDVMSEVPQSETYLNDMENQTQLQEKDTTICKLKDIIKSLRENSKDKNVNYDYVEIEIKNVELNNSVAKPISENERLSNEINHVKQIFKEQFDSIKKTRVRTKEQSDSLIDKLNLKYAKNEDLKAQIQDKVFVITSLKKDLRRIKGKEIVDIAT